VDGNAVINENQLACAAREGRYEIEKWVVVGRGASFAEALHAGQTLGPPF
jgi:hypothetical protein